MSTKKKNAAANDALAAALSALAAANARIIELELETEAAKPTPFTVVTGEKQGPLGHGEGAAAGIATGAIGARGHAKIAKPMKVGGSSHRNFAAALTSAGFLPGDGFTGRDFARISEASPRKEFTGGPCQTPAGVGSNWADKAADAGLLERIGNGAGTKGRGWIVLPAMFATLEPESFELEIRDGSELADGKPEPEALDPEIEAVVNPAWLL